MPRVAMAEGFREEVSKKLFEAKRPRRGRQRK